MTQKISALPPNQVGVGTQQPVVDLNIQTNPPRFDRAGRAAVEPSLGKKDRIMTRTHRCRLYRTDVKVLRGEDFFTEVWDFQEDPICSPELPPDDQLVACFSDESEVKVREQLDAFCQQNGYFLTGSWNLEGSI